MTERRFGAAGWGGEDGEANSSVEVGRRGGAARTERRTLEAKLGGEDGEVRRKRSGVDGAAKNGGKVTREFA